MYIDYMGWHLDFTTPQMILTIKLTSFAFAYADGNIAVRCLEAPLSLRLPLPSARSSLSLSLV